MPGFVHSARIAQEQTVVMSILVGGTIRRCEIYTSPLDTVDWKAELNIIGNTDSGAGVGKQALVKNITDERVLHNDNYYSI